MDETETGVMLGTAGYMAPEQARGKPVDKRADIWAFGVVLYEILTGKRLFKGETASDTIAAVLTLEPDWNAVPEKVQRLLRRCLERDCRKRLRDIADFGMLLEEGPATIPTSRRWPGRVAVTVLAIASMTLAGMLWRANRSEPHPLLRFDAHLGPAAVDGSSGARKLPFHPMARSWHTWCSCQAERTGLPRACWTRQTPPCWWAQKTPAGRSSLPMGSGSDSSPTAR